MNENGKTKLYLGCIADDFTGAGDAASFLASNGMRTLLVIWPDGRDVDLTPYDAVVVALKSRSEPVSDAVRDSLAALSWLREKGAEKFYFKYCSTFDSTRDGNIGPVCDAILESLELPYTILCPSLLSNKRTVRNGILYVGEVPLAESHMKNHPLNPMWDSAVDRLMGCQSAYPSFLVSEKEYADRAALRERIGKLKKQYPHFYLVPDYFEEWHGQFLVDFFRDGTAWTGGSGLLDAFAAGHGVNHTDADTERAEPTDHPGGRLMISGSCSDMTQKQVRLWLETGEQAVMVTEEDLNLGEKRIQELASLYLADKRKDILYYSAGSIGERNGDADVEVSSAMEVFLAEISCRICSQTDVRRLIVAGGETSGAVMKRLQLNAFKIGRVVAPGVPILHPVSREDRSIVLKSGNFGEEDFFVRTLKEGTV